MRTGENIPKGWLTLLALVAVVAAQYYVQRHQQSTATSSGALDAAYAEHQSGTWIQATGRVQRVLPDDNNGARHQRFILELSGGHTVLVAHNIDIASRIPLQAGNQLSIRGVYEWNDRGGVVHWTHHDPHDSRRGGWIELRGRRYQ